MVSIYLRSLLITVHHASSTWIRCASSSSAPPSRLLKDVHIKTLARGASGDVDAFLDAERAIVVRLAVRSVLR